MYKSVWLKIFRPWIFLFSCIKRNTISRTRTNKYADIGSPCLVPLSSLKYCVVKPPLITQDSWLLSKTLIHFKKFFPKPYFSNTEIRKAWLTESNAFSISMVSKIPFSLDRSVISKMSEMSLPLSLIIYLVRISMTLAL